MMSGFGCSVELSVICLAPVTVLVLRIESEEFPSKFHNVALIVGVTGISGNSLADILPQFDTPGGRWKVYGVACRPQPEWQFHHYIQYIQCDMADPEDCQEKLSNLSDVTHIFYVGWVNRSSEAENLIENGKMLRNVLNAVISNAPKLQHICVQTGQKHLSYHQDSIVEAQRQHIKFIEDLPRLAIPDCYHAMEDTLLEQVQKKENLTWSVHRPAIMFGFSPYSTRNIVGSLCVYATICKHEGLPLKFPGIQAAWEGYSEAVDADVVAEQQIWAALEHPGKRQAFNCSNGDVFRWKHLWRVLAQQFQVEFVDFVGGVDSLEEMMRDKGSVWDEIVEERELLPTKLEEIGIWRYVDYVLRSEPVITGTLSHSMDKSQEYGFWGSRDTNESFCYWIEKTKTYKIVPSCVN